MQLAAARDCDEALLNFVSRLAPGLATSNDDPENSSND
jgi:hypothetical protein